MEISIRNKLGDLIYELNVKPDEVGAIVDNIITMFKDAGWLSPEQKKKILELVNQLANTANEAFQMPTMHYVALDKKQQIAQDLMTGQEWLSRFERERPTLNSIASKEYNDGFADASTACIEAAKRATGVGK